MNSSANGNSFISSIPIWVALLFLSNVLSRTSNIMLNRGRESKHSFLTSGENTQSFINKCINLGVFVETISQVEKILLYL